MTDDRHPNERLADSPDPDPVDAEATEPAERPQSRGVTRRALLGGTALGAGLLAYTSDYEDGGMTHSIARAATVPDEPLITVGPEDDPVGYIFESNGDWVFKHEASGNEFFYNSAQDRWETNQELNVPALVADEVTIGDDADAPTLTDFRGVGELGVRPSTGDSVGSVEIIPSGTSARSHLLLFRGNDPSNSGFVKYQLKGATASIEPGAKGTGTQPTELQFNSQMSYKFEGTTFLNALAIANGRFRTTPETKTISSGEVSYTAATISLAGEGDAADTLTDITGAADGDIVILKIDDSANDITIDHGTGNIRLEDSADFTMGTIADSLCLQYRGNWYEMFRAAH